MLFIIIRRLNERKFDRFTFKYFRVYMVGSIDFCLHQVGTFTHFGLFDNYVFNLSGFRIYKTSFDVLKFAISMLSLVCHFDSQSVPGRSYKNEIFVVFVFDFTSSAPSTCQTINLQTPRSSGLSIGPHNCYYFLNGG
jgi:hypothetical protein